MSDQQISCADCGRRFVWSAGEQQFFRERGLQAPRRCRDCRATKRPQATATAARGGPAAPPRPIARRPAPRRSFGAASLAAAALSVVLFFIVPSTPLLAWLIAINLIALLTYGYDKSIAGGSATRVPESVLLGLALAGGSPGAFVAMLLFRHKTSKPPFLIPFALIVLLQGALIVAWIGLGQPVLP